MHEKNIALLCDEADRLLQLNINLLRQMVEEPDVLSDSKNENRLLFDKQKALKRIEELEGEQIKTARREMVLAVVGTMKAGKSTTINAIVGQEILPNRNRPMTSVPTLIRHVPGKTEPVLHLEHIQPVRNLLITLQEKLATPAGQQVAQTLRADRLGGGDAVDDGAAGQLLGAAAEIGRPSKARIGRGGCPRLDGLYTPARPDKLLHTPAPFQRCRTIRTWQTQR